MKIIHTFYEDTTKIQYSNLEEKSFEILKPIKIDISIYFKELFFEKISKNKFYTFLQEHIEDNSKYSIEIGKELYIIELFKKNDFNFYVQNGTNNYNTAKKSIATFYGFLLGYIEGFQIGYNSAKY